MQLGRTGMGGPFCTCFGTPVGTHRPGWAGGADVENTGLDRRDVPRGGRPAWAQSPKEPLPPGAGVQREIIGHTRWLHPDVFQGGDAGLSRYLWPSLRPCL